MLRLTFSILLVVLVSGCVSSINIQPIPNTEHLARVCIKENPDVLMSGFLPELRSQIESHNIATAVYKEATPKDCINNLTYTANWTWDWAMVLAYAELKLYKEDKLIGSGVYDYGGKFMHFSMYGSTASKLKLITDPLFSNKALSQR